MTRARYTFDAEQGCLLVIDLDAGRSVTNDAEVVVRQLLTYWRPGAKAPRILYRDTMGVWDGLAVRDGQFAGFIPLGTTDRATAIARALAHPTWESWGAPAGDLSNDG